MNLSASTSRTEIPGIVAVVWVEKGVEEGGAMSYCRTAAQVARFDAS